MKKRMEKAFVAGALALALIASCDAPKKESPRSIAVFVPGMAQGSPTYEMLVAGAKRAADEAAVPFKVVEGGFNQADWPAKLSALAAEGSWGLIVTSNPSMPIICAGVREEHPDQKFLCMDGWLPGDPGIKALAYNQREQAYLAGFIAGLHARGSARPKVGLIAGQEYPVMSNIIAPGFIEGARAAASGCELDLRIVGNWYDAAKSAELARSMIGSGASVIMPVCGGANQGVVTACEEKGAKIVWFDSNGYGVSASVVGSAVYHQDTRTYEEVKAYLEGKLEFGKAELVGLAQGYVEFITDDPAYAAAVPEALRAEMSAEIEKIRSGALVLEPVL
jgi:simple sugar transport system substrate-binding protein